MWNPQCEIAIDFWIYLNLMHPVTQVAYLAYLTVYLAYQFPQPVLGLAHHRNCSVYWIWNLSQAFCFLAYAISSGRASFYGPLRQLPFTQGPAVGGAGLDHYAI